jgi:hypothetical protein
MCSFYTLLSSGSWSILKKLHLYGLVATALQQLGQAVKDIFSVTWVTV